MKILVENSTWNNIGDGWYQFSLYYMLKRLYANDTVVMGEGPAQRAFRVKGERQRRNMLNVMDYERADVHVLSGPFLSTNFFDSYAEKIRRIKDCGEAYALISISGTSVSESLRQEIGAFLKKYPPLLLASRDEETYNNYKEFVPAAYNGICTAFLVSRNIPTEAFHLEKPFFISSFYRELEPTFLLEEGQSCTIEHLQLERHPTMWHLPYRISRHLNFKRAQQSEVGGYLIVRTIQNLNTRFNHINFAMPNSFISFNPLRYLEVVKSSAFTISDRVHACAVSLAFGKPARLMFETSRAGIFDRMGFDYRANRGIMYPNEDKIDEEYGLLAQEIKKYI